MPVEEQPEQKSDVVQGEVLLPLDAEQLEIE